MGAAFALLKTRKVNVLPEKKLMLSVLLLAVAQQNPVNVRWLDSQKESKIALSVDATMFVISDEFDVMCKVINVRPDLLRDIEPDTAMKLFKTLLSDKQDKHEFD